MIVSESEAKATLKSFGVDLLALAERIDVGHIDVDVMRGRSSDYVTAYAWDRDSGDGKTCAEVNWEVPNE